MARKTERHPTLVRLMDEADMGPSELAKALDVTEQVVTNWGTRGVSHKGAITAEKSLGIASAWILHGDEPRRVAAQRTVEVVAPLPPTPPAAPSSPASQPFSAVTDDEMAFLNDYRILFDSDREHYRLEVAEKAVQMRAHMAKVMSTLKGREKP